MERKGSSRCSEELDAGAYPEPDESSPYNPILII
jgi:hypothetical protein